MMMKPLRLVLVYALAALGLTWSTAAAASSDERIRKSDLATITREDVRAHFRVMRRLDPKVGDLFAKLIDRYGDHPRYTPSQVQFVVAGVIKSKEDLPKQPIPARRSMPAPAGTFNADDVHANLRAFAARSGKDEDLNKALITKYNDQPWYYADEVRDVQDNGSKQGKKIEPEPRAEVRTGWQPIIDGLYHFKIRQNWSDVLASEDPSLGDDAKSKVDDLVGASFSYAHDSESQTTTWSAVGALIFPMEWRNTLSAGFIPIRFFIAPSVSINRVGSNDPAKKEIDQLYYRLGLISKWMMPEGWIDNVQLRAAPVYGTDIEHRAQLPAYEADLEPQLQWEHANDLLQKYLKIGFKNILIGKEAELADGSDDSQLDYQLRTWLHVEGGDLQRAGATWNVVQGSFFRVGPAVQLRANAPTVWKGLSFTGLYSYLPSISGPRGHESLLKLDLTLALYIDPVLKRKVSLNGDYTRGGLDFTKQEVDSFTLGLSVLF